MLNSREVAQMLGVSPVTIRLWVRQGKLKSASTAGGHRRFMQKDVLAFAQKHQISVAARQNRVPRLLLVDDRPEVTGFLSTLLRTFYDEIDIAVANDGFAAGKMFVEFEPDVVLLDLIMPGLGGLDVLREVKHNAKLKQIHVIAMSGYWTDERKQEIMDAGADACIDKPFVEGQIKELVDSFLVGSETSPLD